MSEKLDQVILERRVSEQADVTVRLHNIRLQEPDLALFAIPAADVQ